MERWAPCCWREEEIGNKNVVNVDPVVFNRGFRRRLRISKHIVIAGDIIVISINLYRDYIIENRDLQHCSRRNTVRGPDFFAFQHYEPDARPFLILGVALLTR